MDRAAVGGADCGGAGWGAVRRLGKREEGRERARARARQIPLARLAAPPLERLVERIPRDEGALDPDGKSRHAGERA